MDIFAPGWKDDMPLQRIPEPETELGAKLDTVLLTVRADFIPTPDQLCAAIDEAAEKAKSHVRKSGVVTTKEGDGSEYMQNLYARVFVSKEALATLTDLANRDPKHPERRHA